MRGKTKREMEECMALKDIVDKINSDTNSEIRKIISRAETENAGIISRAQEKALRLRERIIEEGRQKAEKAKARIITMALLDGKKAMLRQKQKILNEVYGEVEKHIRKLDDKGYRSLMKRLILDGCKTEGVKIIVGENDRKRIDGKLVDEVNKTLGDKCKVVLVDEKTRIPDGFMLRDGKTEMDNSIGNIVKSLKEETIDKVAKTLFK